MTKASENGDEKACLEKTIDALGTAMLFAILAVVIGLIIEYLLEFVPGTDASLLTLCHKIGGGVVTAGVAGELVIEFIHGKKETKLREATNSVIIEARDRALRAEERIAELNLLAEQERHARVKLEQKFAPRVLSQEAKDALAAALSSFVGTKRIDVFIFEHHVLEVMLLAQDLNILFIQSGWDSKMWFPVERGNRGGPQGITFAVAADAMYENDSALQLFANRLTWTLSGFGIDASSSFGGWRTTDDPGRIGGFVAWDVEDVAKLRVEVGEKQLVVRHFNPSSS